MFDIWSKDEDVVVKMYNNDNYKIFLNEAAKNKTCIIFFSSNNIWYPNTKEAFEYSFIKNDYYEWNSLKGLYARKVIYLRNIYKSWYVTGINNRINSVDKIIEFLIKETEGYDLITVGSSSGGYMATLIGSILEAKLAISFSGQFTLDDNRCLTVNPFLQKYENEYSKSKYYNLSNYIIKSKTPIYYFLPVDSDWDCEQYRIVNNYKTIRVLQVKSGRHGVPIFKCNLVSLLNKDSEEMENLYWKYKGQIINPILFSVSISGILATFKELYFNIRKIVKYGVR